MAAKSPHFDKTCFHTHYSSVFVQLEYEIARDQIILPKKWTA